MVCIAGGSLLMLAVIRIRIIRTVKARSEFEHVVL